MSENVTSQNGKTCGHQERDAKVESQTEGPAPQDVQADCSNRDRQPEARSTQSLPPSSAGFPELPSK